MDVYGRLMGYLMKNKVMIAIGVIGSLVNGLVLPSMGLHVARILSFELIY